jgi:hypothetical protein
MEVHHHPNMHHKPKPWKEYFLEFVMIFLAVTLGFIAENLREHITDSAREQEYAGGLYQELTDDSTAIANILFVRQEKVKDMDYICRYFLDSSLENLPKSFYPAFTTSFYLINSYTFEPKDAIVGQLRSSGALRYFKSIELQKALGDISVCINNIRYRNDQEYQFFANPLKIFLLKHFDFGWMDSLRNNNYQEKILGVLSAYRKSDRFLPGVILNKNSVDRKEAANMVKFYKQMMISSQTLQIREYIRTNHKILELLRNEYGLGK